MPADFSAVFMTNLGLHNLNPNLILSIAHNAYKVDGQWGVETTGQAHPAGYILRVTHSTVDVVDGTDGASGTIIPAEDESILQLGAADYTAFSRPSSRAEAVNMYQPPALRAKQCNLEIKKDGSQ